MFTDIYELMLFSVRFTIQISDHNYLKIMLEFFQNLFKIFKNRSKMGSWRVLGPLGGPSERPGGLGIDF